MGLIHRVSLVILLGAHTSAFGAGTPQWSGKGRCRLLVHVKPVDLGQRTEDELVAQVHVDFDALLRASHIDGQVDLSTLQVHKYSDATGEPEKFKSFDTAMSPFDRPCRFEDEDVPENYPDRANYASDFPNGKGPVTPRKRGARLFNRAMNNDHGRITWVHTQAAGKASSYAIYWDFKGTNETTGPSPSPWIGDVDVLRRKDGELLSGFSHFTVCAGDLNGDGLFDLMASTEKGDLMWFPNRGQRGKPLFDGCLMAMDEDGPIDMGWYGAPFLFDWDNDGLLDVLAGTSHNVILWWKNIGTRTQPKLSYRGFVQSDGHKLEVPESPVPEDTAAIFARDYFNQPWVGDWDGDGIPDILTGGYTTGLIFFYKGTGRDASGVPTLISKGSLEADGKPIDTIWAAAPAAGDVNNDGKPELISGAWFWSGIARPPRPGEDDYLMYFSNTGSREKPALSRATLPKRGTLPSSSIARPNLLDCNDDGLLDLLVSNASGGCCIYLNVGTKEAPMWDVSSQPLTGSWGFMRDLGFTSAVDVDGDGRPELLSADVFRAFKGSPYSPHVMQRGVARVDGKPISHPGPGYGDPYYYTLAYDWDHDGIVDLLWGTQQGNIYLHRGLSRSDPFAFAPGIVLKLKNGPDLRVGPAVVATPQEAKDFTILQGSRIIMVAADFDGDHIDDLGITETYGNLIVFRNTRNGGIDTFEPGLQVGKVIGGGRSDDLTLVDWNEDGKPDLMIGQTAAEPGTIYLNQSLPGQPRFAEPIQPLHLPFVFWGASLKPMDWNGDGDEDFIINSEFYTFYAERSFLKHGYRMAEPMGSMEIRKDAGP